MSNRPLHFENGWGRIVTQSTIRLLGVFIFCSIANWLVARDQPIYLQIVHVGNVQIIVFYFVALGIQKVFCRASKVSSNHNQ